MSDTEVITQVYEAFASQDLDRLIELVHPECVITQDSRLPWGGRHVGHDGVSAFAIALVGSVDSTLSTEALFEADGQVIQTGRARGTVRANGATYDVPEVHVWTVDDGKVVAAHFANDTAAILEAIGQIA